MPTPWVGADRPDRRKVGDVFSDRGERLGDESGGGAVQGVGVYGRRGALCSRMRWRRSPGILRGWMPALGRFLQPDMVVPKPGNLQGLNRFAYIRNKLVKYRNQTGRWRATGGTIID